MDNPLLTRGLVHVYTGDGKGKTTAALGVALRALGWGARVCVVQFVKGYPDIGEAHFARLLPDRFVLRQFAIDLSKNIDDAKVLERRAAARKALDYAASVVAGGDYDVVVLDEVNVAVRYGLIDAAALLAILRERPPHVEVILTGRGAPPEIIEAADYVTKMLPAKHPYHKGTPARKGIDY